MNTATLLVKQAEQLPNKTALIFKNEKISFKELDEMISRFAYYFRKQGIQQGSKVLLFIKPSVELPATTFALFKIGAIPVFIDPGMGRKNLLTAIAEVTPDALIGVPLIHHISKVFRSAFKTAEVRLDSTKLREASRTENTHYEVYDASEDEMAAILFTSGGTGKPKGVIYTHKIFMTQTRLLQEMYSLTSDDIDCPYFSLFSFFTIAMGMTSCIPDHDTSKPSEVDPSLVVDNIAKNNATFAAGSPAVWSKVGDYCVEKGIQLPTLKYLVMFGAAVDVSMHEKWQKILPNGTTYTPYGATESLPISNISGDYIMQNTARLTLEGAGVCVGKAVESVQVMISNEDEIMVCGDTTTREYYNEPLANAQSKLILDDRLWHKVGDVGSIDEEGHIWFWGRKVHIVELKDRKMYSVPCEIVFNQHPDIRRTALIGPIFEGRVVPCLVVELKNKSTKMTESLLEDLQRIRDAHEHTRPIERFFLHKSFPVDVRHNIKIDNIALKEWAEKKYR
ncbi:MAG: fatty acid CoA ligase family protein [Coriobacteriia bacterium]|nr:fatty acid CoA ligase family protein [Coriobacteriia bacterium]